MCRCYGRVIGEQYSADIAIMAVQLHERRRGYRQKASAMALLRLPDAAAEAIEAHVFELSMHGVGMSVNRAFDLGTILDFAMCDGRQSGARVEVRSCRPRADKMFDIGGQFC